MLLSTVLVTNLELVLTKELYHCYYFRSMKCLCHVFSYPFHGRNRHIAAWGYNWHSYMPDKYFLSVLTLNAPILKTAHP